jgi:hypothetical protein
MAGIKRNRARQFRQSATGAVGAASALHAREMIEPPAASLQMLDHVPRNQPAYIDALTTLHTKWRAPQGKADVAGEIFVKVPLILHATV